MRKLKTVSCFERGLVRPNLITIFFLVAALLIIPNSYAWAHIDVTSQQAKELIGSTDRLIAVDVREVYEYCDSIGHIPGALNYPWNSEVLQIRYEELPADSPILVVCRSGGRSNRAANFLDSKGFSQIYDMLGGMQAWLWETTTCVDVDDDGINDDLDNCPNAYNPSQIDSDWDNVGNACDKDCPNLDALNPVAFPDFSIFAHAWQQSGPDLFADLNQDGIVDINDLAILASYWLSECYEEQNPPR